MLIFAENRNQVNVILNKATCGVVKNPVFMLDMDSSLHHVPLRMTISELFYSTPCVAMIAKLNYSKVFI